MRDRRRSSELAWYDWLAFLIWLTSTIFYLRAKGVIPSQALGLPAVVGSVDVLPLAISGVLSIYGLWKRAKPLLWVGAVVALALMMITPIPVAAQGPYFIYASSNGKSVYNGTIDCGDLRVVLNPPSPSHISFKFYLNGKIMNSSRPVGLARAPLTIYKHAVDRPINFRVEMSLYDEHIIRKSTDVLEGYVNKTEDGCTISTHYWSYGPSPLDFLIMFLYQQAIAFILTAFIGSLIGAFIESRLRRKR